MLATALLWVALAQAGGLAPVPRATTSPEPAAVPADYQLGPSDLLAVSVIGLKEYTQPNKSWIDVVVSNSGKLHLPFLGVMNVGGMTTTELQAEMLRRFREDGLLKDPQIIVTVQQYRASTIYILGEIAQPGQYFMREEMYMMDLLGLSLGWPTSGIGYLYRRAPIPVTIPSDPSGEGAAAGGLGETHVTEAIPIDFHALASGERPELNVKLQPGDVFYVPYNRAKLYYVTGEVGNSGQFELPPARPLLVSQAVASAGGPTRTAKLSQGILVRFAEDGSRQELPVDFEAIFRGRKADFPIQENDIIFIPGSNAKTLGLGLLRIIPNVALWW